MVKDGKKLRKKKTAASSSTGTLSSLSTSAPIAPAPLRVTNHINVPVRHQIKLAQLNKELQRSSSASFRQKPVQRTSYRKTWEEEELERKAEERRRKGQDPDWDVILSRNATLPLVIVDGYNVIHKWSRLKKHMLKGDTQRARQLLLDDLENLGSLKGWRIEVVFDGSRRNTLGPLGHGPGPSSSSSNKPTRMDQECRTSISKHGVRVVYTGVGTEADSYIEARCAAAKNVTHGQTTGSFIVATDDQLIRLAGQNAGAWCMGSERFVTELKAVKQAVAYRVEAAVAKVNGHAIRPEKLRGTQIHRFGRGSVLIEDKRKRKEEKMREEANQDDFDIDLNIDIEVDENGIPWWAKVPNHTKPYR